MYQQQMNFGVTNNYHLATPSLQRKRIELERVVIDEQIIVIASRATIFCDVYNIKITPSDVLLTYKEMMRHAKACGAKVVYKYRTKKKIESLMLEATIQLEQFASIYKQLQELCRKKVAKGIYEGCCDDDELKHIYALKNKLASYRYRTNPLGQLLDMHQSIRGKIQRIKYTADTGSDISLYV